MRKLIAITLTALPFAGPAFADQILGPGRVDSSNRVVLPGGATLGRWEGSKYIATPDALTLPQSDQGSTGNISGMSTVLKGTTKALPLSDDTAVGYSVARFGAAGVTTCAGNDAVDDSVAINATINYVASVGGGKVTFPVGADCRLKTPIIAKTAVRLIGQGAYPNRDGIVGAVIRPAVNMTNLITQPDIATMIYNFQIEDLVLDGRANTDSSAYVAGRTVTYAIDLNCLGCQINRNVIKNMAGGGLQMRNPAPYISWVNWITQNQFLNNTGWSARLETTDSVFSNNYMTVCGVKGAAGGGKTATENGSGGCLWTKNFGNIRFIGNQIEVANTGVLEESVDAGSFPAYGNTWIGNFIDLANTGMQMKLGAFGAGSNITYLGHVVGNRFNNSTDADVTVPDRVINAGFLENHHMGTSAATAAHFRFATGSLNPGWRISGQFALSGAQRITNPPTDLILQASGSGGALFKLPNVQVGPDPSGGKSTLSLHAINGAPTPTLEWWAGTTAANETMRSQTYFDPATGNLQTEFGGAPVSRILSTGATQFQTAVGFNGATPAGKCTLSPALGGGARNTDIVTAINAIRTCLVMNGLAQ